MENTLAHIIETILASFIALIWWLWRTDRSDQNERILELEHRMVKHDQHKITREEFNGVASSIRVEFRAEHNKIIEEMRASNEAIRTEMRECNKAITDRMDRLIEARAK